MNAPTYGLWLLLGIVLAPVYLALAGWFLGTPHDRRLPLIGVGFLVGLTGVAWGGMALFALMLEATFF